MGGAAVAAQEAFAEEAVKERGDCGDAGGDDDGVRFDAGVSVSLVPQEIGGWKVSTRSIDVCRQFHLKFVSRGSP